MKQYYLELINQAEIVTTQEEAKKILCEIKKIYHLENCLTLEDASIFHD